MKKACLFFGLALFMTISSCTDFVEEDVPVGLSLKTDITTLSENAESFIVTVRSADIWSIDSQPSWIETSSISRSSSSIYSWDVIFDAQKNNGYNREGTIVFSSGSQTLTVTVNQVGKYGAFIPVESVFFSSKESTLSKGERFQLTYNLVPINASDQHVDWRSSAPSIATVSSSGLIEAIASGISTITITTRDGGKQAQCKITVITPVDGVVLNESSVTITEGETYTLTATISPADADNKSVTWSSSNTKVATVSASGIVTAKSVGSTTLTVTTNDGNKTASCLVTVKAKIIPVSSVSLSKTSLLLVKGETEALSATVLPINATDQSVIWSSDNLSVATVSTTGIVTAKKAGSASITAQAGGISVSCSVRVQEIPEGAVNLGTIVNKDDGTAYYVFWAEKNLGAMKPEGYGDYYAWGEVETKSEYSFSWGSYKWGTSETRLTKYVVSPSHGIVDGKTVLELQDDAANYQLGGKWRMATDEEWRALINQCSWSWKTIGGINGYEVSSQLPGNTNSIFLPAAGHCWGSLQEVGEYGTYWTSSGGDAHGGYVELYPGYYYVKRWYYRPNGLSIRPVCD